MDLENHDPHATSAARWYLKRQRELRALIWQWDPLGIMGVAESEYDCLAAPVLAALSEGVTDAHHLRRILRREVLHMGLKYSHSRARGESTPDALDPIVDRIRAWWESAPAKP
jgi:hypothetical protein